jgi:hypothetical protein
MLAPFAGSSKCSTVYPFASQIPCRPKPVAQTSPSHGVLSTQTKAHECFSHVCTASDILWFVLVDSFVIVSILHMKDYPYENSANSYGENPTSKEHCNPS